MRARFAILAAVLVTRPLLAQCREPRHVGNPPDDVVATTTAIDSVRAPRIAENSIFLDTEHPVIFPRLDIGGYDRLAAALTVEDKGARVSYAPFLYHEPYTFLDETRILLSQANGETTFGLALRNNPSNPRTARGKDLWTTLRPQLLRTVFPLARRRHVERDQCNVSRFADSVATLTAALERAPDTERTGLRQRLEAAEREFVLSTAELNLHQLQLDSARGVYDRQVSALYLAYRRALLVSPMPSFSASYNATLFPTLFGTDVDADDDGNVDNHFALRRHAVAGTVTLRPNLRVQASALGSYSWERPSAEAGTHFNRLWGGGLTIGAVVADLVDSTYFASKIYRETLFVPQVVAGLAGEMQVCESDQNSCKDKVERRYVITPFVDFKVRKEAQFRLGFPITSTRVGGTSQTGLGLITTVAFQLGLPN